MEIRVLARQGMTIRAIAHQLRVSRNTVRKYLRTPCQPIYPRRAARQTKLDPFKPYFQARIQAAKPHWIPATVLLRELRERGYSGGNWLNNERFNKADWHRSNQLSFVSGS